MFMSFLRVEGTLDIAVGDDADEPVYSSPEDVSHRAVAAAKLPLRPNR
jgi:hypothetical protein